MKFKFNSLPTPSITGGEARHNRLSHADGLMASTKGSELAREQENGGGRVFDRPSCDSGSRVSARYEPTAVGQYFLSSRPCEISGRGLLASVKLSFDSSPPDLVAWLE